MKQTMPLSEFSYLSEYARLYPSCLPVMVGVVDDSVGVTDGEVIGKVSLSE